MIHKKGPLKTEGKLIFSSLLFQYLNETITFTKEVILDFDFSSDKTLYNKIYMQFPKVTQIFYYTIFKALARVNFTTTSPYQLLHHSLIISHC